MQVGTERQAGSELHAWRQFLARSTLWLGVLLLGSAAICWVAANWQDMTKVQRFAGTQGLLAISALAAAWAGLRLRGTPGVRRSIPGALLALAGILLGALLALLGQTYQTGADTWELFAWWALLLLPWALAAGSQVVWLLWVLVLNVAAALWLGERMFTWLLVIGGSDAFSLLMAGLNLLLLLGWELAARRWRASTVFGPRILAALVISALVMALMLSSFLGNVATFNGIAWIAVTLGLGFYYHRGRRDLIILAMLAAGVICVSLRFVGEWLLRLEPGVWAALPLAALLMAEAVLAARWLRQLAAESRSTVPAADAEPSSASAGNAVEPADSAAPVAQLAPAATPQAESPWYVQCLLGLSAWLATLLLLVFVAFSGIVTSEEGALIAGLVLCGAGVAVLRSDAGPFWRQCGTAMAFAGQLLIVYGMSDSTSFTNACFFVLLMAAVVYALGPDMILRFLSGLLIATAGAALIWRGLSPELLRNVDLLDAWLDFDPARASFVWLPIAVIGAWATAVTLTLSHRLGSKRGHALQPLAWAFLLSVQGMVWLAGGISAQHLPGMWQLNPQGALLVVAGALLPAAAAMAVLWPRRHVLTAGVTWGVPIALLILAFFWLPSPGVGFALAWLLLGFGLNQLRVAIFGVMSLLAYLGVYYYQLDVPLLQKALWLGGGALLLFILRGLVWLVPRLMRTQSTSRRAPLPPVSAPLRWRTLGILGGLALVLVVANGGIWQREKLLATGKVVILELAPVDPRSLMQGDYMALDFAASRDITRLRLGGDRPVDDETLPGFEPDGYVMLQTDARGVATPLRIQPEVHPHADSEVPLRYRVRDRGVRIVTNAWFFQEGEAQRFEVARYGELRVADNGEALLVRMLGADLQPL
ncbi:GDYXXLXY domain-containing protein [Achromobacter pestifer]|uniref:GDYXXLXY domain-containing protein n=1 Tax=Achromobacter pestifer TaxID=1353889 RepID=A0A6S6ZAJ1_9BURK|nr:GDYXXLXY domain-containing protein [Achromobacter pestifer]CAB3665475.1 hypothetical protein LMG3431_03572 [Achromobacter pestifer]